MYNVSNPHDLSRMDDLLKKSDENWRAGNTCFDAGLINSAATRYYYSAFQAVKAYAISVKNMQLHDRLDVHGKAQRIVYLSVVGDDRNAYVKLRTMRETADYLLEGVDSTKLKGLLDGVDRVRSQFKARTKIAPTKP